MKKIIKLVVLAVLATSLIGCGSNDKAESKLDQIIEKGEIVMVTSPDYSPYEFIDPSKSGQEQYVGADIELAKYIAEKLGVELKIEALDFDSSLASIAQGSADVAICAISYDPLRAESMDFTKTYSFSEDSCSGVLIASKNIDQYQEMKDFDGKVIGTQNGTIQMEMTQEQIKNPQIELVSNVNDGVMNLLTDKIDGFAIACTSGDAFAAANNEVIMANPKFEIGDDAKGNVIAVTKGETELLEKLNEIIDEVNELNLYTQWEKEASEYAKAIGVE